MCGSRTRLASAWRTSSRDRASGARAGSVLRLRDEARTRERGYRHRRGRPARGRGRRLTLVVRLDRPLPGALRVGRATAVLCSGVCFDATEPIATLAIMVGDVQRPVWAFGLPRPDAASLPESAPVPAHAFRSGFSAMVTIVAPQGPGELRLRLAARLRDGTVETAELGRIAVVEPPPVAVMPAARALGPGLIAVCMATFEPDMELFARQVRSLREQTDRRWVCVISDDGSTPERYAEIEAAVGGDERFALSRAPRRLGFYRNFERALELIPAETGLVALCDQDDRWDADKLRTLRDALGPAVLAYSDMRVVDVGGRVPRAPLRW